MKRATAKRLSEILLQLYRDLNDVLMAAKKKESEKDFLRLRRGIGEVLGIALTHVLSRVYFEHPDLSPPEMRHFYPATRKKNEVAVKPQRSRARKN